jgi:hypothetical protein
VDVNGLLAIESLSLHREVRWNSALPLWLAILAGLAAVLWTVWIYRHEGDFVPRKRRVVLAALRSVAAAILLIMLLEPVVEQSRQAAPRLMLLLDRSASMTTRDVPAAELPGGQGATETLSRVEAWKTLLSGGSSPLLARLSGRFDVQGVSFANGVDRLVARAGQPPEEWISSLPDSSDDAALKGTRLGDAVNYAAREIEGPAPAAIVALTDGVNTAGLTLEDAAGRARAVGTPVFAIALGSDRPRPDVVIDDVLAERVVFPGDRLQVEATVRAIGRQGQSTRVVLKNRETGETLAETSATFSKEGESTSVRLALRPTEAGPLPLAVEAEAAAGEENTANNRVDLTVDVRNEPIRVLLVDSTPSYEYRALKSLLERDPAIKLRVLLQDADLEYPSVEGAALATFPPTPEALLEYDVVILGDVDPQQLPKSTWANLKGFVSNEAGGLVLIAGPRFMPRAVADIAAIETLLPIEPASANQLRASQSDRGQFSIVPTKLGLQEPSLQLGDTLEQSDRVWKELPPVSWLLKGVRAKAGAEVLAEAVALKEPGLKSPAIMRQRVGAGEVLMHATDETWRWRRRSDDRYFARYWGQAVRRLARGKVSRAEGSLASVRTEYPLGADVTLRARLPSKEILNGEAVTAELTGANHASRHVQLVRKPGYADLFEGVVQDLPADRYTASLSFETNSRREILTEFTINAPPREMAQLAVNSAGLAELARQTGGKLYTAATAERLIDDLPAATPTVVERLPDEPLWNRPWLLAALGLALGSEWLLRRRSGLL